MKKIFLSLLFCSVAGITARAQLQEGGLPASVRSATNTAYTPTRSYPLPDWEAAQARSRELEAKGLSQPYLVGLFATTDIGFPTSGSFTTLTDGSRIWSASVKIEGAPAIGFYYDRFKLPQGVKFFLSNSNGKQILGAYTAKNNTADNLFVNEAVQGSVVNLELNIAAGVRDEDIQLHIDRALVYFNAVAYLKTYVNDESVQAKPTGETDPFGLEGRSSRCMIDAICPQGADYAEQRKSSLQFVIPVNGGASACTGTMVNNTGNNGAASCKPYLLTASHCENTGTGITDASFSQWLIRFNFEKESCNSNEPATVNTLNGANFRARSPYNPNTAPTIGMPDFLLLELRESIPENWDVYFSGWDRSNTTPNVLTAPKKYITFHHAAADIKKLAFNQQIAESAPAAWSIDYNPNGSEGGVAPGSSGSGLFNGDKRVIAIASTAGAPSATCGSTNILNPTAADTFFLTGVDYYKLSAAWEFGTENNRRLKPWLDPANTGVTSINNVKSNCQAGTTSIHIPANNALDEAISLYPNPTTNGKVTAKINLKESADLTIDVYAITGSKLQSYHIPKAKNNSYSFDLGNYANGIYLLKFNDGHTLATKKVMLQR